MWEAGHKDPLRRTRKEARDSENAKCIGGLRDPAPAMRMIPGWRAIGARVSATLAGCVAKHPDVFSAVLAGMGQPDAVGPPP